MKTIHVLAAAAIAGVPASLARPTPDDPDTVALGPPPADGVGCVPRDDHWDCDGPAGAAAVEERDDDDFDDDGDDDDDDDDDVGGVAQADGDDTDNDGIDTDNDGVDDETDNDGIDTEDDGVDDETDNDGIDTEDDGVDDDTDNDGIDTEDDGFDDETDNDGIDTDDEDDGVGTGVLGPSPTESVGCKVHGDHWHCDGPASTAVAVPTATGDETDNDGIDTDDEADDETDNDGIDTEDEDDETDNDGIDTEDEDDGVPGAVPTADPVTTDRSGAATTVFGFSTLLAGIAIVFFAI